MVIKIGDEIPEECTKVDKHPTFAFTLNDNKLAKDDSTGDTRSRGRLFFSQRKPDYLIDYDQEELTVCDEDNFAVRHDILRTKFKTPITRRKLSVTMTVFNFSTLPQLLWTHCFGFGFNQTIDTIFDTDNLTYNVPCFPGTNIPGVFFPEECSLLYSATVIVTGDIVTQIIDGPGGTFTKVGIGFHTSGPFPCKNTIPFVNQTCNMSSTITEFRVP